MLVPVYEEDINATPVSLLEIPCPTEQFTETSGKGSNTPIVFFSVVATSSIPFFKSKDSPLANATLTFE